MDSVTAASRSSLPVPYASHNQAFHDIGYLSRLDFAKSLPEVLAYRVPQKRPALPGAGAVRGLVSKSYRPKGRASSLNTLGPALAKLD
jgi:hypothetical protein